MKRLIAAALAASFASAPAFANETEDFCVAFAGGNGWDTEPCSCVGEVGEANADVKAEILALVAPEDTEAMSDATKQALSVCFPDQG